MDMPFPFISVIIPVYNDVRLLSCLEALQRQSYPNFEVIVVDNCSTEAIPAICERFHTSFQLRYCYEAKPGNNAARNTGIRVAQGTLLAFTDADCIPHPDWLSEIVNQMRAGSSVIGGAIHFFYQSHRPHPVEYADSLSYLRQQDYVEQEHYAAGANLAIQRWVIDQVGGFEERLLNLGDREWGQRAYQQGFEVVYCPDAIVYHPARATLPLLLTKARRQTRAAVQLARLRGQPIPTASFLPLGWHFWRTVFLDPNLPTLLEKLEFIWIIHRLKWTIAATLRFRSQH